MLESDAIVDILKSYRAKFASQNEESTRAFNGIIHAYTSGNQQAIEEAVDVIFSRYPEGDGVADDQIRNSQGKAEELDGNHSGTETAS